MTSATAVEERETAPAARGLESQDRPPGTGLGRADIQGLRALAVVLVVLDHLGAWPHGGFVGVDIFFVISGFLITALLLREQESKGRTSILGFYKRRIKRIVPAAVLVLGTTVIASSLISYYSQAQKTSTDAIWSAIFWANWHFQSAGTDYFQQGQTPSPLQHYWSLSVEEQFYFVWPVIMVAAAAIGVRLFHARRVVAVTVMIAALTALAFTWSMHESATAPTAAYFSTFSRAWELGAGALLACLARYIPKLSTTVRCLLSAAGLLVILYGASHIDGTSRFPAPWGLVPILGAVLVIAAGVGTGGFGFSPLLSNRVSRYLGDISYSLYLWHFPVIVLLGSLITPSGAKYYALAAGLVLFLSALSYLLVENPIRNSSWFDTSSAGPSNRRQPRIDRSAAAAGVLIVVVAVVALVFTVWQNPPVPGAGSIPTPASQSGTRGVTPPLPVPVTPASLRGALATTAWPSIDLSPDALLKLLPAALSPTCFNAETTLDKRCTFGPSDSKRTVVLFGDSISMAYEPTINAALPSWKIVTFGKASCPWADARVSTPLSGAYSSCLAFHKQVFAEILALHPSVIIVSGSENSIGSLTSGAKDAAAIAEWATAERSTLGALAVAHAPIYVLSPPPTGSDPSRCATRFNSPKDCIVKGPGTNWDALQSLTSATAANVPNVKVIDTSTWLCVENECPAIYQGEPIRTDGQHLTETFARGLAANFLTAARSVGPRLFANR